MPCPSTRLRALALYKDLLRLARDYPDPACVALLTLHQLTRSQSPPPPPPQLRLPRQNTQDVRQCVLYAFITPSHSPVPDNRHLTDNDDIDKALKLGDYIRKETLALYSLRKYRHLKRMYPSSASDP
ncbi:hypothetical protein AX15_006908 [Amanita polypyramis BW_CC]|nr:hypothetical protein AX15_006908 [Amanita polypyramis BW_CC]